MIQPSWCRAATSCPSSIGAACPQGQKLHHERRQVRLCGSCLVLPWVQAGSGHRGYALCHVAHQCPPPRARQGTVSSLQSIPGCLCPVEGPVGGRPCLSHPFRGLSFHFRGSVSCFQAPSSRRSQRVLSACGVTHAVFQCRIPLCAVGPGGLVIGLLSSETLPVPGSQVQGATVAMQLPTVLAVGC